MLCIVPLAGMICPPVEKMAGARGDGLGKLEGQVSSFPVVFSSMLTGEYLSTAVYVRAQMGHGSFQSEPG